MNNIEINERIELFNASMESLIENHEKNKYSKKILNDLYGVITNALDHIGIENINLIYSIFCKIFPEYAGNISLDYFMSFLCEYNGYNLINQNDIILFRKSGEISNLYNFEYFYVSEDDIYEMNDNNEYDKYKFKELSDDQWNRIAILFNDENLRDSIFKKPKYSFREIINGIFWIIINNRKWRDMPKNFPSFSTCNKYYNSWKKTGFLNTIINKLSDLIDRDILTIIYKNIYSC